MRTSGKLSELSGCSIKYLERRAYHSARSDWGPNVASAAFLSRRLDSSRNLYRKDLYAHYGCVNAIEFSKEGDLLVSGGDDRRVLLWNVDSALSGARRPRAMESEHSSNIFCLSFDSSNSKIFSAGNDEQVIVHDLRTGETTDVFLHREAVYGVSVNPSLDSVFASAGEDGQVLLYDMRESAATDPVCLARYHDAFHAVQFHPVEPVFVVTANSREGVSLWDVRKPRVPVLRYGEKRCAQSSMCARFNRTGNQIIALRRRLPPVLYNTHSSKPVCQFDAEHYYNSCTMKSCCFAGDNDQFVLSGSDDFNLYMWKIPGNNSSEHFVSEAHMVLKGHRSIVNQVRFNPQNFIIASSGVEKIVKLWSGLSLPGSKGSLKTKASGSFMTRRVYTHEEYIGLVMESGQDVNHDYSHGCTDEDPRMMAFFDSLVQREVEGWTSNTDLSDDIDNEPQTSGHDDDDTETTTTQSSLSVVTSQSDDNDSETTASRHAPGARRSSPSAALSLPRLLGHRSRALSFLAPSSLFLSVPSPFSPPLVRFLLGCPSGARLPRRQLRRAGLVHQWYERRCRPLALLTRIVAPPPLLLSSLAAVSYVCSFGPRPPGEFPYRTSGLQAAARLALRLDSSHRLPASGPHRLPARRSSSSAPAVPPLAVQRPVGGLRSFIAWSSALTVSPPDPLFLITKSLSFYPVSSLFQRGLAGCRAYDRPGDASWRRADQRNCGRI
ncbi:WD repeat-containing protein 22 [Penaeus vannamei]|uniref:WD repeat-containing protein 22 n=1 Tax=Penaeus vannamei TaxID=6689 RepID=A0A423TZ98_PENVA|nr:WD repeat-containing protein 22 [Penaeus vannamei]